MFSGELDRSAFAVRILMRALLCFVGVPLVLLGLAALSCRSGNLVSACFTLSIVAGMFGAHIIYLLFMASSIGPVIRRLQRLQLPVWLVAFPILFFLADVQSGASFIHSLMTRFVLPGGASLASSFYVPRLFLLALVCLLALWLLPDRERTEQSFAERWGVPGLMTFGMLVLIGSGAAIEAVRTTSLLLGGIASVQAMATFLRYYSLYSSAIIILVMTVLTARWQKRVLSKAPDRGPH